MIEQQHCTQCGSAAAKVDHFCRRCGTALDPGSPPRADPRADSAAPDTAGTPAPTPPQSDAVAEGEWSQPAAPVRHDPFAEAMPDVVRSELQGASQTTPDGTAGEPTPAGSNPLSAPTIAGEEGLALHVQGQGNAVPIPPKGLLIGVDPSCDLPIQNDAYVSSRHAQITPGESGLVLEDLASTNGTYLRVRDPVVLKAGDEIRIGTTVLRVGSRSSAR